MDASSQIGTGHFMRCYTLACELAKQDAQVCFISQNLPMHLIKMLINKEMKFVHLGFGETQDSIDELAHASWLGTSQARDAQASKRAFANHPLDLIVVDHYALDHRWESAIRENCEKLMVIDDLADRKHDCDILLDQNYYPDMQMRYNLKVPAHCRILLGPHYALLREEFRLLRMNLSPRIGEVKRILVFFGGIDVNNYTGFAIQALEELNVKGRVDVVIGAQHPKKNHIQQSCAKNGYVCHVQTSRMAQLMAEADLAIGAGGSASWERCCLGLPSLLLATADNQVRIVEALASIGACFYDKNCDLKTIENHISFLLSTPSKVHTASKRAYSLVDGEGAIRVVKELGF